MTHEALTELNRKIAVMEAYRDGREIEYRRYAYQLDWRSSADPSPAWNWAEFDYRVKPVEPRRIFVPALEGILYDNHFKNLVELQEFASHLKYESHYSGYVEFVEVTHEVRAKLGL